MRLLNPRFSDAGALPGEAAHWTIATGTSLEVLAGFGTSGWEDFERWSTLLASLADVTVVRAFYGNAGFEAFEQAWANSAFLFELSTGRLVTCSFSGAAVETWALAGGLLSEWTTVPSVSGLAEDFVRPDFVDAWANVPSASLATETFSGTWSHAVTL